MQGAVRDAPLRSKRLVVGVLGCLYRARVGGSLALEMGRMVVYTCITAGYDEVQSAPRIDNLEFVLVTDLAPQRAEGWNIRPLPAGAGTGALANRFIKMHPEQLFQDYDISIYVDGNVKVSGDIAPIARSAMESGDIALFEHPFRRCLYLEAQECAAIGYDWCWTINRQMRRYREDGYPVSHGLYEANVIVRRHHSPGVRKLMAAWWSEYTNGVRRDQLSLSYLSWKLKVPIVSLGLSEMRSGGKYLSMKEGHLRSATFFTRSRGWINRKLARTGWLRSGFECPVN